MRFLVNGLDLGLWTGDKRDLMRVFGLLLILTAIFIAIVSYTATEANQMLELEKPQGKLEKESQALKQETKMSVTGYLILPAGRGQVLLVPRYKKN